MFHKTSIRFKVVKHVKVSSEIRLRSIPIPSNHSCHHKIAAWNSIVFRLVNIPMDKIDYSKELI